MITYFDTSAVIPLILREPATPVCQKLWTATHRRATSLLTYVEAEAAIAQAHRIGRVTNDQASAASALFQSLWQQFVVITPESSIIRKAATLAHTQGLRGYDAVQCASALAIADGNFLAVSGDHQLINAWKNLGLITALTSQKLTGY